MLKKIYLSPLGWIISAILNALTLFTRPFMSYGHYNRVTRRFNKFTRISSTATLTEKENLDLGDHVWIWHYTIIDASNGVKIARGCQIGAWVGIFTHGSHIAIRLLGEQYLKVNKHERIGYQRGPVEIGEFTFIGAQSIILPGVKIGKGCIIGAQSMVTKSVPDYAIVTGSPAAVIGDTRKLDKKYLSNEAVRKTYYDADIIQDILAQ